MNKIFDVKKTFSRLRLLILILSFFTLSLVTIFYYIEKHFYIIEIIKYIFPHEKSEFIVGNIGNVKVKIPSYCAELVEYDNDPTFGEKRILHLFKSRSENIRGFGIDVKYPSMECKKNNQLYSDYKSHRSKKNPWISISVTSGEYYPTSGSKATNNLAKRVTDSIHTPTEFWFANYKKLPSKIYDLDAYVVKGIDPKSGKPANKSDATNDVYINHNALGFADTYISCNKTFVPGGIATCEMQFGLEPDMKALIVVYFTPFHLHDWLNIKKEVINFILDFQDEKFQ